MTPETALNELRNAMDVALIIATPPLLVVLVVGVVVSVLQAATQINEPSIAFIAKVIGLVIVLSFAGNWMMVQLVEFTISLFQRIPALVS